MAGLLLLALQPPTGSLLRERLFKRLVFHRFGALLAARGKLLAEEHQAIIMLLGSDSRYLLWLSQWGWVVECPAYCARHLNLHAGLVMLPTPLGQDWLGRLLRRAADDAEAAAAALILQPNAPEQLWNLWADTIAKAASGTAACPAGRFARHTWSLPKWRALRERLKPTAMARGRYWCEWHRHVSDGPEAEAALADPQAPLLWCLELLHATNASDAALRRRLQQADPSDQESAVALAVWARWRSRISRCPMPSAWTSATRGRRCATRPGR